MGTLLWHIDISVIVHNETNVERVVVKGKELQILGSNI